MKFRQIDFMLESVVDAASANDFVTEINTITHIGTSLQYAKTKFKEKANSLQLKYDKEAKIYKEAGNE